MQYGKYNMAHSGPTIFCRTTAALQSNRERGFSLLEVLIALLVLSVGLLGIAGLQTVSLRFNHQSYERTQATVLMSEMFEKIIANPDAARNGSFNNVADSATSASYSGYGGCPASCTPSQLATYDIFQWKRAIEDPKRLAQGQGVIELVADPADPDPTPKIFKITIRWVENGLEMNQIMIAKTLHSRL